MSLLWLTNWRRVESRAVFCLSRILNLANISLREYLPWSGFASTIYMHVLLFRSLIGMDEDRRNVKEDQRLIRVSMKVILGLGSHRSRGSLVTGKYSSPIVRWSTWYLLSCTCQFGVTLGVSSLSSTPPLLGIKYLIWYLVVLLGISFSASASPHLRDEVFDTCYLGRVLGCFFLGKCSSSIVECY